MTPAVVIRPIPALSVNHSAPSGPAVMAPEDSLSPPGTGYSVATPAVVTLQMLF